MHGKGIIALFYCTFILLGKISWPTHSEMALNDPELLEHRTAVKTFHLFYVLVHDGKMAEIWEAGEPNHPGETREEDLQ